MKVYRGSAVAARNYVEADRSRADDYYLAEGTGLASRYVASPSLGWGKAVEPRVRHWGTLTETPTRRGSQATTPRPAGRRVGCALTTRGCGSSRSW